jgi:hypothetical protein
MQAGAYCISAFLGVMTDALRDGSMGKDGQRVQAGQAACMPCLIERGAGCDLGLLGGQAIGKALETNSTLQSLNLQRELGVGLGLGRGMHLRGMAGGRAHAWRRPGRVCAHARTGGWLVYMWVLGDVQYAMG